MPDDYRVTIRLAPELYAQLEARGSHGQPLAVIVRQALADYLTRPPDQTADTATQVATLAARVAALHAQVQHLTTRLDALAATGPPGAAETPLTAATWQPEAAGTPDVAADRQPTAATPGQRRSSPARHGLPRATLLAIADERTLCEGLSLREFAERLHDKGIYSARAKDGSRGAANPGNVKKWLDQARAAGLL